jgi:multiple sugar transport system ATP-binding protein
VRRPSVFLLDQPLGNLDAKVSAERRVELRRLHRELGATVISATHDQVEAMALGDRIAILRDGELQQVGTPRGVYEHPANLYVAGFVGSPPMNLVAATLRGTRAVAPTFSVDLPWAPEVEHVVLGIRPESLRQRLEPGQPVVEVTATQVAPAGPYQLLQGRAGPDELVARIERSSVVFRGDRVRLAVHPDAVHVFDAATGRALL